MSKIRIHYDKKGKTMTIWFDDPKKEVVSEEIGDGTIVSKDKKGKIIGFEKLYVSLSKSQKDKPSIPVEIST